MLNTTSTVAFVSTITVDVELLAVNLYQTEGTAILFKQLNGATSSSGKASIFVPVIKGAFTFKIVAWLQSLLAGGFTFSTFTQNVPKSP
jgi:hypothetical protein